MRIFLLTLIIILCSCIPVQSQTHKALKPPPTFVFHCDKNSCQKWTDSADWWIMTDEDNGLFMECHNMNGRVLVDSRNCYDFPHQPRPLCRPKKGRSWYDICVRYKDQ